MIDKRVFDSNHLGSENEKNTLQYDGWAIAGHVNAQNYFQTIQWVEQTYRNSETEFNEQGKECFLSYGSNDRAIRLIPEKVSIKDSPNERSKSYNLTIYSDFFGYKGSSEKAHIKLLFKILSKIPKKRAYIIKENKRFPVGTRKTKHQLRIKTKRTR